MLQTLKKYALLFLFAGFLLITSVVDMFLSHRTFSEMENRYLQQRPAFSLSQLLKNEYTPKYETYVNDQFVGRDQWITLKSISEWALGKIENNGIVYGAQKYMFEHYRTTDERRIALNIGFVNKFLTAYGDQTNISVGIIPNSYTILTYWLPDGLDNLDQRKAIADIYEQLEPQAQTLDLVLVMDNALETVFKENPSSFPGTESPIYYRTDHHWTTLGAYRAYQGIVGAENAVPWEQLMPLERQHPDFYGSYYSKCKLFSAIPDTIREFDIPITSITIDGEEKPTLNDVSKWEQRDKHAAFLWGNNGVTVIKSNNNLQHKEGETSRIMLIKDSYGNSLAPFFTYNYDEVYVIDLRSLPQKMSELMAQTQFDRVIVLYNFMNFSSDTNIARMTY